jgi:hypothetical protein
VGGEGGWTQKLGCNDDDGEYGDNDDNDWGQRLDS